MNRLLASVVIGCLLASNSYTDERPTVDLKPLFVEIDKVVKKHYPKAKSGMKDDTIQFSFNLRKFMIHEPLLNGEWQDAFEEIGPQKGGVLGTIELRSGPYGGMAVVPQSFDKRYFTTHVYAPYSKKLNSHLYIHLKSPRDTTAEFVAEFEKVIESFEKHLSPK